MKYDLAIFDCDGVLIDSEIIYRQAVIEEITKLGIPMSNQEIEEKFVGISYKAMEEGLQNLLKKPLPLTFRNNILNYVFKSYETDLKMIPGIENILTSITIKKCIATNSSRYELEHVFKYTNIQNYFEPQNIFTVDLVENGKPNPELFLLATKTMGANPNRSVVIEDSITGVTAAVAAGIDVIGLTVAAHTKSDQYRKMLLDHGVIAVVDNTEDLLPIICG